MQSPLLPPDQEDAESNKNLTEEFFMYEFKTLWCPKGSQHNWQTCSYAHNYQDARRRVEIGYGPKPCPEWNQTKEEHTTEYAKRCKMGLRCPYAHGHKEQLYHPDYFRTVACRDQTKKKADRCERVNMCAFFHHGGQQRRVPPGSAGHDYSNKLREEALPQDWAEDFMKPPFGDAVHVPDGSPAAVMDDALPEGDLSAEADADADALSSYWIARAAAWTTKEIFMPELPTLLQHPDSFCALPYKLLDQGDGTPRTDADGSELGDDSSTSTALEVAHVSQKLQGPPGLTGYFDDTPWKVQEPNYGAFGGHFGAFPGFLAAASLAFPCDAVSQSRRYF